jgi:cytochrome P450
MRSARAPRLERDLLSARMVSTAGPSLDELPAYEQLGLPSAPCELEQFDHLAAYRRLGPIYQLRFRGERWVVLGGMEANDAAWRNPDQWDYHDSQTPFRELMGPTHVTQLDGDLHRRKRRNLKPGFAMSALVSLIPELDRSIAADLAAAAGQPLRLHDFFMTALTRANSRSVLRCEFDDATAAAFIRFEEHFIRGTSLGEGRHAHYAQPEFQRDRATVFAFLGALVDRRLAGEKAEDGFQAMLDDRRARGEPLDRLELIPEAYLLLMAGTGNTAKLLNAGLQHVLQDPVWLGRLREELTGYAPDRLLGGLGTFPLLKATLLEIERLFPAAPVLARTVAEPFVFQGYTLDKGTKVLHLQTLPHFLEEIYAEPYRFHPGRWLERDYPKKAQGTYGGSTHLCLGINLVRLHMPIALANILAGYEIAIAGQPRIAVNVNYGVPQVADLTAVLTPRARATP